MSGVLRNPVVAVIAVCGLLFSAGAASAQPGGSFGYRTYAVGNVRYAYAQGVLNPLAQGQQYVGVWIRTFDANGRQSAEGQIPLNQNLQFQGAVGDFQMATFAVVVRYRQGNGPIQTIVSPRYTWRP